LLARFETTLRHSPFLFGEAPVYSDFLLFGVLGNMTYGGHHRLHATQRSLAAWSEKMERVRLF
jgi:glutathione S-transferase